MWWKNNTQLILYFFPLEVITVFAYFLYLITTITVIMSIYIFSIYNSTIIFFK